MDLNRNLDYKQRESIVTFLTRDVTANKTLSWEWASPAPHPLKQKKQSTQAGTSVWKDPNHSGTVFQHNRHSDLLKYDS